MNNSVAVLGAGSWGTALAILLARNGASVPLWGHEPEAIARLAADGENRQFLPGHAFPPGLAPVDDLARVIPACRDILVVVPSHAFREVLDQIKPLLRADARVAWATKGLEAGSGKLLHQVAAEVLGEQVPLGVISGPTFAGEVAAGLPTAATLATTDDDLAEAFVGHLHGETFRTYTCDDLVGVQIGGALKNVLAIAAGIADGLGFGANTRAALITRGLAELMRLGEAMGGRRETFMGLAGMGDLVLTCTDDQSRNRRLGLALGRGDTLEQGLARIDQVVEGVATAREMISLGRRYQVELPIAEQVYHVLHEGLSAKAAVHSLLAREPKAEVVT